MKHALIALSVIALSLAVGLLNTIAGLVVFGFLAIAGAALIFAMEDDNPYRKNTREEEASKGSFEHLIDAANKIDLILVPQQTQIIHELHSTKEGVENRTGRRLEITLIYGGKE